MNDIMLAGRATRKPLMRTKHLSSRYARGLQRFLGFSSPHWREFHRAAASACDCSCSFHLLLCPQQSCKSGDPSRHQGTSGKPGCCIRATDWRGRRYVGLLVGLSVVAPSFQASDLIKVLGIGSVAIGFAFQNILQNFLAGLLLLWSEPFRVGDEIKLDPYEGTVEDIQPRATIIKTYDQRRVVIPNADLFTHSVIVNTAFDTRRWEHDLSVKATDNFEDLRSRIVQTVK